MDATSLLRLPQSAAFKHEEEEAQEQNYINNYKTKKNKQQKSKTRKSRNAMIKTQDKNKLSDQSNINANKKTYKTHKIH